MRLSGACIQCVSFLITCLPGSALQGLESVKVNKQEPDIADFIATVADVSGVTEGDPQLVATVVNRNITRPKPREPPLRGLATGVINGMQGVTKSYDKQVNRLSKATKPYTDYVAESRVGKGVGTMVRAAAPYAGAAANIAAGAADIAGKVAYRYTPLGYAYDAGKSFADAIEGTVKYLTGYNFSDFTFRKKNVTPPEDSSILGNYTNETHYHHYATLEWQLDKAIKELEATVRDYTKTRQKIAKGDPSVMNKLVSNAKGHMTAWWEAARRAEENEQKMRRELAQAEISGKEDALIAKFKLKQPTELTGQLAKDFKLKYDDAAFKGLKGAIEFYWTQMSEFQQEDKVVIKTWIYCQQQLYLSAFRQIFKSQIIGSFGQIRNGLDITGQMPWLVWILGNVTELAAVQIGADPKELFYEVDAPLVQHIRDLANEDPLKIGLKEWLYKTLTAIVKKPGRRTAVENNLMKYIRPSEKKLLRQQGVRPEVINLKAGLALGEKGKKDFDKMIQEPLTELLNEMREKGARSREKKLEAVITEIEMGRYITAFRILMKNEAGDGLYPQTIKRAMDIAKGVAGLKLGNSGLAKEVAVMFDRLAPRGRNSGERFKKIRKWANTKELQTVDFAQKVFEECFPTEHYNMFVNVFLDRMSKDMREYSEPKAFGKIKPAEKEGEKKEPKEKAE